SHIINDKVKAQLVLKQSLDGAFTKVVIEPAGNTSYGNEPINLSQCLPDTKLDTFLKDIISMFNLVIMDNPDKPNDLIIEPADDFFASKQKIKWWDDPTDCKVDMESIIQTPMSELDARQYYFAYKEDDDYFNEEYTIESNRIFGDYTLDVVND